MVVLIATTIGYLVHRRVEARRQEVARVEAAARAEVARVEAAQAAEQQRITQALDAVKALRSMTKAGITYHDYIPRVADTQVQVDRYLETGTNETVKTQVRAVMGIYKLASDAWQLKLNERWGSAEAHDLARSPLLDLCPAMKPHLVITQDWDTGRAIQIATSFPLLWGCASTLIDQIGKETIPPSAP